MKSILLGIIVLNVVVVLIGLLLMLRNLVSSPAFNIGLAITSFRGVTFSSPEKSMENKKN